MKLVCHVKKNSTKTLNVNIIEVLEKFYKRETISFIKILPIG
jgi:hypothetical protein